MGEVDPVLQPHNGESDGIAYTCIIPRETLACEMAMAIWVVRGGREGERHHEKEVLEKGVIEIRFGEMRSVDLSDVWTRDEIKRLYVRANPGESVGRIGQRVRALWLFRVKIQIGDRIIMPVKRQPVMAVGEVSGNYEYTSDSLEGFAHRRKVTWADEGVLRSVLSEKCNRSINRPPTVFEINKYADEIASLFVD